MGRIYGYCRISTKQQKIERQERNILERYPEAIIYKEAFTGARFQGRKELDKILRAVKPGDIIVFDEVSRMSRNASEGFALYQELFDKKIDLIFLKEPHINTMTYRESLNGGLEKVGNEIADMYIETTNRVLMLLAKKQIQLAFEQAQHELEYLHTRTREGMARAKEKGHIAGRKQGVRIETKKAKEAKEIIKKHNKTFGGTLNNEETWKLAGISKMTFYKYQTELLQEDQDYIFFWGIKGTYGFLSNFYDAPFTVNGVDYKWSEQYFMCQKASLFNDEDMEERILKASSPQECKRLGRKVSPFDGAVWDSTKEAIMYTANIEKFSQNPDLMERLRNTGDSILVEASPKDKIWGIGLSQEAAESTAPENWPGQNLLGKILMKVRKNLPKKY